MKISSLLKLAIISGLLVLNNQVNALTPNKATEEDYLIDHGHSNEMVRMVNMQKRRTQGNKDIEVERNSKVAKFLKNLYYKSDLTLFLNDFGYDEVKTVESDFTLFNMD